MTTKLLKFIKSIKQLLNNPQNTYYHRIHDYNVNKLLNEYLDHYTIFKHILFKAKGLIYGDNILYMLMLVDKPIESTLKIAIDIRNSKLLMKFFKKLGYILFVNKNKIYVSNTILYNKNSTIKKICNCETCDTDNCINGTVEITFTDGNPNDYINSIAKTSYQRIKFNGKKFYGDFLELTLHGFAYTVPNYNKSILKVDKSRILKKSNLIVRKVKSKDITELNIEKYVQAN
jgi:hypothetical protein